MFYLFRKQPCLFYLELFMLAQKDIPHGAQAPLQNISNIFLFVTGKMKVYIDSNRKLYEDISWSHQIFSKFFSCLYGLIEPESKRLGH